MKISRRSRANISPTDVTTDDDNRTGKERNVTFGSEVDICHSRSRGSGENCFLCREESWLPIFWSTSSPRWRPEYEQIMRTISGILHCRRKINLLSTVSSSVSACSVTYGRHLVDFKAMICFESSHSTCHKGTIEFSSRYLARLHAAKHVVFIIIGRTETAFNANGVTCHVVGRS